MWGLSSSRRVSATCAFASCFSRKSARCSPPPLLLDLWGDRHNPLVTQGIRPPGMRLLLLLAWNARIRHTRDSQGQSMPWCQARVPHTEYGVPSSLGSGPAPPGGVQGYVLQRFLNTAPPHNDSPTVCRTKDGSKTRPPQRFFRTQDRVYRYKPVARWFKRP